MSPQILTTLEPIQAYLIEAAPVLALLSFIFVILALIFFTLLERRITKLTGGKNGNIEETLSVLKREVKELRDFRGELESYLKVAEMRLRGGIQGMGIVRFNPFAGDGSGGNQSFAIALLDDFGDGVVLSSLYARDRVGIYCKPIEGGKSTFELSEEEREAVERARKNIAGHKKK